MLPAQRGPRERGDAQGRGQARRHGGLPGRLVRPAVDGARDRRDGARQLRVVTRLDLLGAASGRPIPRRQARPAGLRRVVGTARLRLERSRARRRHRPVPGRARDRPVPSDRRQVRRLGLHAARERPTGAAALALPVRVAGTRQRQWQRRSHSRQGRAPVGDRDHAVAARQHGVAGADAMVGGRAHGQDQSARRLRRVGGAHRHGARAASSSASPRRP